MKVKEDVIAELHGNLLKKDEEIASLKSLLDEQKNKNNVSQPILPFKEAVLQNSNKLAVYSGGKQQRFSHSTVNYLRRIQKIGVSTELIM